MAPLVETAASAADVAEVTKATKDVALAAGAQEETPEAAESENNNAFEVETEAAPTEIVSRKRVQFEDADVVEFEPTMWTATVASDGVPVGMSTNVRRRTRRRLDSYESEREMMRVDRQVYMEFGYLEPEERLDILENNGNAVLEMTQAEQENLRINRERWESNEYDLMYQYGLGEVPVMDLSDDDDEMEASNFHVDDPMLTMDDSDDGEYFFSSRNLLVDADVRFAMEMDAYDVNPRAYEELSVDYASDCILGDDEDSDESNELPYSEDAFDAPLDCAEDPVASAIELSSSPSDVADGSDCLISACAKQVSAVASPSVAADASVVLAV